ncbi:Nucleotide-sugar transporter [Penicillium griseofulvum]|uniref:DNA 3'-5' helicase n=1 Tax=Penicillium patulum TaxID=5078 RepID=A0A135LW28_PENPA|nr:Nucleotide-sugar transporter [Penicillium griseofulvum]KXG53178.1 Nucleotide-sugar transporter [Penicillium griseofulvum]
MPPAGGKRYLTSTAVFLVEVVKLAISLTMALYDVSKTAPPSMPATSLFFSLTSTVFSGDSWKLAIPAGLEVLSNSLLFIALSNLRAASFQITFQLKFLTTAVFGLMLLKRSIPPRKWGLLLLLVVGVALVQIPDASPEQMLQDDHASHHFPRSLEEWKAAKQGAGSGSSLQKRSATYEGIEEDILTADPHLNPTIGLLATVGASLASGLASIYFEKVLKDSSSHISLWVRNVQLAIYSVFPALFIGIVFREGEMIAEDGFFQGYNWAVWSTIIIQALGGIFSAFYVSHAQKDARSLATTANIILSIVGSIWLFDFEVNASFLLGSAAVLVATHYYGNPTFNPVMGASRPPPIRIDAYEKDPAGPDGSPVAPPNDFSIKLPTSPFLSDGMSSSRPTSPAPGHTRLPSQRRTNTWSPSGSSRTAINDLASSAQDDDVQLDAFDLELLASEDREEPVQDSGFGVPRSTPLQASRQPDLQPPQFSRFFQPSPSIASRWNGSSSSDPVMGPPSSPLALFCQKKDGTRMGQRTLESNRDPYHDETSQSSPQEPIAHASPDALTSNKQYRSPFSNIPPSVQGIVLVSVNDLPENYRSMFPFPLFNAIQSKSFHSVYNSNDNIVLSAPTGSGKTVVMELAICRLLNTLKDERFKVVYQAPTKSLCSERFRDWHTKFSSLNLKCAELTGDTDHMQLRNVQSSQIIITTPEKWDSMTRKWKDHMKLMQIVKLFLIDEVHILKETRGATLEAVVSRMKNIGSNVRFVALSATVPNSEDIATWLGKDATNQHVPAHREHFGEEFRPVMLKKFVYGHPSSLNDFAFDKVCGSKLWKEPKKRLEAHNEDLKTTLPSGVAFHHAGLGPADRHTVETGFRDGHISVICCTSTLAVGINLPCHLVIIKNTVSWQDGGCKEYSDLEMMQMLGRAGRPQFDDSATAVILTRKERVAHYEKLVQGSESLESCLHLNLIDHLNAEIGLGNISDVESAVKWLAGTFLFVRLRRNPTHYKLKEGANQDDEDELLRQICEKDIDLLRKCGLVEAESLCSTQFGEAMARYYIQFETMKILLSLKPKASVSETLNVIAQAEEFREIRLKAGEKSLYREINRDPGIRFPIKVDLALPAHKISLLLQSELGGIEYPDNEQLQKLKFTFQQDKSLVFAHVNRLIRCLIDCQIARGDSIAIRNALELARSFGAKVWDHSPLQMKQIEQVGVVAVRKLAAAGITSIEGLECAEPHQIEMVLSKNPPFGSKLLSRLKDFPKLRISVKMLGKDVKINCVNVRFKVEVAFMNDTTPRFFQRRPVYVCCLIERSDGHMIDFRRASATKLQEKLEMELTTDLTSAEHFIACHVMCDEIAGTSRKAELQPSLPSHFFAGVRDKNGDARKTETSSLPPRPIKGNLNPKDTEKPKSNTSRPHERDMNSTKTKPRRDVDDFDGDDLQLDDFLVADERREKAKEPTKPQPREFDDIDWFSIDSTPPSPAKAAPKAPNPREDDWGIDMDEPENEYEPVRLANGKWACNHKCKDKTSCKHFCCREGLEKPPKPPKRSIPMTQKETGLNQLTISNHVSKAKMISTPQVRNKNASREKSVLSERDKNIPSYKRKREKSPAKPLSSDYGDETFDDLPSPSCLLGNKGSGFATSVSPVVDHQPKNNITDAPAMETKHTEPKPSVPCSDLPHKDETKQSTSKPKHEIIEIPDDTPPNSMELPVTTPTDKHSPVKQSTVPLPTEKDSPANLKRKAGEPQNEEQNKRVKQSPFVTDSESHTSNILNNEQPPSPEEPGSPVAAFIDGRIDFTATWDDGIDLLDEFKDIIKLI